VRRILSTLIFLAVTSPALLCYGQQPDSLALEQAIRHLKDPDWKDRSAAFHKLLGMRSVGAEPRSALAGLLRKWPDKSDEIKLALIKLLEKENVVTRERSDLFLREYAKKGPDMPDPFPDGEERSEYYATVVAAVTSLRDTRSLDALLGAIQTGGMVTSALAGLGSAALDRVIEALNSSDAGIRLSAGIVLGKMLDAENAPRVNDPVSRQKIKGALIRAAGDRSPNVRLAGVQGLPKLGDRDVTPLIQNLATSDPAKQVRDAANEALKKLR